jgi:hypothetical protein
MKMLADAVKELKKDKIGQSLQKPKPPEKDALGAVPSNRTPPAYHYHGR